MEFKFMAIQKLSNDQPKLNNKPSVHSDINLSLVYMTVN